MTNQIPLPTHFIHQATRYALGRMSYAVAEHCQWLIDNWDRIPGQEKAIIQKDVEEAIARDDRHREMCADGITTSSPAPFPLGMDCDRVKWDEVRALWGGGLWKRRNIA